MMHINNNSLYTCILQLMNYALKQRLIPYSYQCFGHVISKRLQSGT